MSVVQALLKQRHSYYRALLIVEVVALAGLRALQEVPQLVSVAYLVISGVGVLMDSPLLPKNRLTRHLGGNVMHQREHHNLQRVLKRRKWLEIGWLVAAGVELVWQAALVLAPPLAVQLSVLHIVVWLTLMLYVLWSLMNALAEEPLFNGSLLMGAAAGYLLIGFTGGIMLNSLLVLDPAAFHLSPSAHQTLPAGIAQAPQMLGAAFGSLTTLGSAALNPESLTSLSASVGITIVGQLYVAILIAGVLGKPRQLAAVRKAAHRRRQAGGTSPRLRRIRR
jgi:FtsH-binding integral membrane protein